MMTPINGPTIGYGPGDEETWGGYAGHPNDPRNDDDDTLTEEELESLREQYEIDRYLDRQDWNY